MFINHSFDPNSYKDSFTPCPVRNRVRVIDYPVTALSLDQQTDLILRWAQQRSSRYVCVANVHMLMEAHNHDSMSKVLEGADLVTPDGMPLVWMMRMLGIKQQERVCGVDILVDLCQKASNLKQSVYFLGSDQFTLGKMRDRLEVEFPNLQVAAYHPLPFRPLSEAEDAELIEQINASGAGIVFVSLGCPKQERWMAAHRDKINAVMIGLGGAFPVYAGLQKRAPELVRNAGLEWAYRLAQEPKRLWNRYASTIPPFAYLALKQLTSE
ncbi:MAG: WecB/TagA/CpsF family glycosyltransferase [Prochlorotrichaceae cyanobacterium]|jgi:N-acetylglucosaminyldiphosphoundecaprenol N-acetyl-beta-D-mannosaminyltransferase